LGQVNVSETPKDEKNRENTFLICEKKTLCKFRIQRVILIISIICEIELFFSLWSWYTMKRALNKNKNKVGWVGETGAKFK